jgi:SWIM zinc finger
MSIAVTPSVVNDIVDSAEEREFWIVVREHERPPYQFPEEGVNNRLNLAARLVYEEHVHPQSDGTYVVDGSGGRRYRVGDSCSCPASQKSKSKWCKHMVAVALYVEWQRRLCPLAPTFSPVALGTLRAGTAPLPQTSEERREAYDLDNEIGNGFPVDDETLPLPLPPSTIDERLAQATAVAMDAVHRALATDHMPQEDRMPEDEYIPEPDTDDAPVAVLDAPVPTRALTPIPPQVVDLEMALQTWTTERAVVRRFLKQELQANIDYYTLRIGGKDSKPSLSKAGAEKVMGWLKLQASFTPDTGTWEMLGKPQDLVCYVCTLRTRSGEIVGEGRGARSIKKDGGDVNKAIKMAEKSANVSAVLRTGCLSDVFTSDLEDMQESVPEKATTPAKPTSQELRQRIWAKVQELAPEVKTREACEAYIKEHTGMDLHPDLYEAIAKRLYEGGR